jgi:mono/diheme cytochrome c family protein
VTGLAPAARKQRTALFLATLALGWVACGAPGEGADTTGTDANTTDVTIGGHADGGVDAPADVSSGPDAPGGADAGVGGQSGGTGAAGGNDASIDRSSGGDPITRGSYLVRAVLACGSCHSPLPSASAAADPGLFLSGRDCFATIEDTPGDTSCLGAPNLTPDPTGIGRYSDPQLTTLIFDGVRPDGTALAAAYMPSYQFHLLTADDAAAVVAYLRSLPPVPHDVPGRDPRIKARVATPLSQADLPVGAAGADDRGRTLAGVACVACHSPQTINGGVRPINVARAFTGGQMYAGLNRVAYAPNLTIAHPDGSSAHLESIVRAMRAGIGRDGLPLCSRMPGGPGAAYAQLSDDDAHAIASYLASLPPSGDVVPRTCDPP